MQKQKTPKQHIDKLFKLRNIYQTKDLSYYYCNTKQKVPEYLKSHIVYKFAVKHVIINLLEKQMEISEHMFKNIVTQIKSHQFAIIY